LSWAVLLEKKKKKDFTKGEEKKERGMCRSKLVRAKLKGSKESYLQLYGPGGKTRICRNRGKGGREGKKKSSVTHFWNSARVYHNCSKGRKADSEGKEGQRHLIKILDDSGKIRRANLRKKETVMCSYYGRGKAEKEFLADVGGKGNGAVKTPIDTRREELPGYRGEERRGKKKKTAATGLRIRKGMSTLRSAYSALYLS